MSDFGLFLLCLFFCLVLVGALIFLIERLMNFSVNYPRRKARKQREEAVLHKQVVMLNAQTDLTLLLCSEEVLSAGMPEGALRDLWELLPMVPFAESLSLQGKIGVEQEAYLREYLAQNGGRYNLAQFKTAAIQREGVWDAWRRFAGMEADFAGEIWHTLVELICRMRDPELCQKVIRALEREAAGFWKLSDAPEQLLERRWHELVEQFNALAEREQQTPYLYAVMYLQVRLGALWAVPPEMLAPRFTETAELDGRCVFVFDVWDRKGERRERFAVEKRADAAQTALRVWQWTDRWEEITDKLAVESDR